MLTLGPPQRSWRWKRLAVLLVLLIAVPGAGGRSLAASPTVSEHELKAVYLYNFLRFVTWPGEAKTSAKAKVIAVVGHAPPVEAALRRLQEKLANSGQGTSLVVTFHGTYRPEMDLRGCHLLYVADSEQMNFAQIIASLGQEPVLTVAEGDAFLQAGGMIALVRHSNSLRWAINRQPLARAGLRLSVKLLEMAIKVIRNDTSSEEKGDVFWFASVI